MKLVWEDSEMGWICSDCGERYSDEEAARMFGYNYPQTIENFEKGYHCMGCGGCFTDVEVD